MSSFFFKNEKKIKKAISVVLVLGVIISLLPINTKKVEAQWVVWDPGNFVPNQLTAINTTISAVVNTKVTIKEFLLDFIAYSIVDLMIQRIAASTVNWINSGFRGSPAFVTDPGAFFTSVANQAAGDFIYNNPNLNFLCGPIRARIRITLATNYTGRNIPRSCTLDDAIGNMEDFINDFERGGWQKFFRLTQEQQNNPIGAYIQAEGEMAQQIASRLNLKQKELDWGNGFLSLKTCQRLTTPSTAPTAPAAGILLGDPVIGPPGSPGEQDPTYVSPPTGEPVGAAVSGRSECIPGSERTTTPGAIIQNQLDEVLSIGGRKLSVADEINEIMSALLNQLVNRIIGGIGSGLRSLSRPDPLNNNNTFTGTLHVPQNDEEIKRYINTSQREMDNLSRQPTYNPRFLSSVQQIQIPLNVRILKPTPPATRRLIRIV